MENKKFSWSHSILAVVVFIYLVVNALAISCIIHCFANGLCDYAVQIIIALFTFDGTISAIGVSFYEWKAKNENQAKINGSKYDKRLALAMKICEYLKDDKLDVQSVALLKDIISDGTTSIVTTGIGGGTIIEDTKFGNGCEQNLDASVDKILSDLNNNDEGMG